MVAVVIVKLTYGHESWSSVAQENSKWHKEHTAVRKGLGALSPSPPPHRNCGDEGPVEPSAETTLVDWTQFKPRREADLLRPLAELPVRFLAACLLRVH